MGFSTHVDRGPDISYMYSKYPIGIRSWESYTFRLSLVVGSEMNRGPSDEAGEGLVGKISGWRCVSVAFLVLGLLGALERKAIVAKLVRSENDNIRCFMQKS